MGEMAVGAPPEEIAATVSELRETRQPFWLRPAWIGDDQRELDGHLARWFGAPAD
jgi:hypothetical protein